MSENPRLGWNGAACEYVFHTGLTICMGKLVQMFNLMKKPIQHKYKTKQLDVSVFQTKET